MPASKETANVAHHFCVNQAQPITGVLQMHQRQPTPASTRAPTVDNDLRISADQHVGGFFGTACSKRSQLSRLNKARALSALSGTPRNRNIKPVAGGQQRQVDAFPSADFKGKVDRPLASAS
jgi:hypothetical protein